MDVSVGRERMLKEDLLFSAIEVIAQKFGYGFWEEGFEEFYFESGEVDCVEGFGEI